MKNNFEDLKLNVIPDNGFIFQIDEDKYLISKGFFSASGDHSEVNIQLFNFFEGIRWDDTQDCRAVDRKELLQLIEKQMIDLHSEPSLRKPLWSFQDKPSFFKDYDVIQNGIKDGKLEKAVPITEVLAEWRPKFIEILKMAHNVVSQNPKGLYFYLLFQPNWGVIGATPEFLFQKNHREVETMALAGTLPKSQGGPSLLLADQKELKENLIVANEILKKLNPLGEVWVGEPESKELPTIWHILRKIKAKLLIDFDPLQLTKILHPTPALGVSSNEVDHQWLKRLTFQKNRGFFGAPLVLNYEGRSIALVSIRHLSWENNWSYLRAGCGIVSESVKEKEWNELLIKLDSIKNLLGLS